MKIKQFATVLVAVGICCVSPRLTYAALVTNASALVGSSVIDFSQYNTSSAHDLFYFPTPVQIGGLVGSNVTWEANNRTANNPFPALIGNGVFFLDANGLWDNNRHGFAAVNGDTGAMTFRFLSAPVSGVGGFVDYTIDPASPSPPIISALGANDVVLESYNLAQLAPISTPLATDAGAFRGIQRNSADILAFRVSNTFTVLDDLRFTAQIPEPSSIILAAFGFTGLAAWGWRRRNPSGRSPLA